MSHMDVSGAKDLAWEWKYFIPVVLLCCLLILFPFCCSEGTKARFPPGFPYLGVNSGYYSSESYMLVPTLGTAECSCIPMLP